MLIAPGAQGIDASVAAQLGRQTSLRDVPGGANEQHTSDARTVGAGHDAARLLRRQGVAGQSAVLLLQSGDLELVSEALALGTRVTLILDGPTRRKRRSGRLPRVPRQRWRLPT